MVHGYGVGRQDDELAHLVARHGKWRVGEDADEDVEALVVGDFGHGLDEFVELLRDKGDGKSSGRAYRLDVGVSRFHLKGDALEKAGFLDFFLGERIGFCQELRDVAVGEDIVLRVTGGAIHVDVKCLFAALYAPDNMTRVVGSHFADVSFVGALFHPVVLREILL